MNARERRAEIARLLAQHGEVALAGLAERFDVSEMTVRRDLKVLEVDGVARRVRSGAIDLGARGFEPPFRNRESAAPAAKTAIAEAALTLVEDGQTLIIDSGTTALAFARALRGGGLNLTVLTPSVLAAVELANEPTIRVILTGGVLRPGELSLIGCDAEAPFDSYNCDLMFLGVAGCDAAKGLTDYNTDEAQVKRAALRSASRIVALVDATKLGRVHLAKVMSLSELDVLVTDADSSHPVIASVAEQGAQIVTTGTVGHIRPGATA